MARVPEFKILRDRDGNYYWHLEAASNRIVAWSAQGYVSKQSCVDELYWIPVIAGQAQDLGERSVDHDPDQAGRVAVTDTERSPAVHADRASFDLQRVDHRVIKGCRQGCKPYLSQVDPVYPAPYAVIQLPSRVRLTMHPHHREAGPRPARRRRGRRGEGGDGERGQRHKLAWVVQDRPELLTGVGAGTHVPSVLRLIDELCDGERSGSPPGLPALPPGHPPAQAD